MSFFWGKYRGKVELNLDPENRGRLYVTCAAVTDMSANWAMPCVPMAGILAGVYAIPPVGANVWVEFEGGNPEMPIWSGCFWGTGEVPAMALTPPQPGGPIVIQAPNTQNRLIIHGTPGQGVVIETVAGPTGPTIRVEPTGITLSDGKGGMITIMAGVVTVNQGALLIK